MSIVKLTTPLTEILRLPALKVAHGGKFHVDRAFSLTAAARVEMPTPERVEQALTAAADSIEEHGATPAQAAAVKEITRIVKEPGSPSAAAQRLSDLIEEDSATEVRGDRLALVLDQDDVPSDGCGELDNQCRVHRADGHLTVHYGPEHKVVLGDEEDFLTHRLVRWGDHNPPAVEYVDGGRWSEIGLPGVDALIDAAAKQLGSLIRTRAHLAAALGEAPPAEPPENQKAQPADGATGTEAQA